MRVSSYLTEVEFTTIRVYLPMFLARLLTGNDGCERWTTQSMWTEVLNQIKIVVCTYQILFDALCHGFVRLDSLALLVFDEAHHCFGKHVANKIMQNFYHPARLRGEAGIPNIIGLTASPLTSGSSDDLGCVV